MAIITYVRKRQEHTTDVSCARVGASVRRSLLTHPQRRAGCRAFKLRVLTTKVIAKGCGSAKPPIFAAHQRRCPVEQYDPACSASLDWATSEKLRRYAGRHPSVFGGVPQRDTALCHICSCVCLVSFVVSFLSSEADTIVKQADYLFF